ncbi:hypothetical protein [Phenylobacterium sp.]|uniref:hypothetical protein n=1 Tax=Phenylobacterium sp. TaxID=1871053 RepID=UPI002722D1AD|nr:hypothetical protein [Phenylobacterium sp.]MDO8380376.1 hypothetical protein [Phenylobacterium sp.]
MAEPEFIDPAEFARWLSPALALKLLKHLPLHLAVPAILFRIEADEIRVAAEKRITKRSMTEDTKLYGFVPKDLWPHSPVKHMHDDFWSTGDVRVRIEDRYGHRVPTIYSLINVRFDPADIGRLLPQPMPDFSGVPIQPSASRPAMLVAAIHHPEQQPDPVFGRQSRGPMLAAAQAGQPALKPEPDQVPAGHLPSREDELAPKRIARRSGQRKAIGDLPFVPDDKLTLWYEQHRAKRPNDVHRVVKPLAEKHFQGRFKVGKNQLYYIMRVVQGGKLKVGKR